ncbi:MAG TPA: tRNA pseudouridine(55) synthase TruB [Bacillota bacterium]
MTRQSAVEGAAVVIKPPGMTSHDVVAFARRALGQRRVGHTGSLDPLAAGVLVLLAGRATRASRWFLGLEKAYRVEALFGLATSSGDLDGAIVARGPAAHLEAGRVRAAAAALTGRVKQRPPAASALRVAGERAYRRARRGEAVTLPVREVEVRRFDLVAWRPGDVPGPRALFDVECSSGTYVRSLVADLGRTLAVPAVTSFLLRTRVGPYGLEGALTLAELAAEAAAGRPPLMPLTAALGFLPAVTVDPAGARAVVHGRMLPAAGLVPPGIAGPFRLLDDRGRLLAVARSAAGRIRYEAVFAGPGGRG